MSRECTGRRRVHVSVRSVLKRRSPRRCPAPRQRPRPSWRADLYGRRPGRDVEDRGPRVLADANRTTLRLLRLLLTPQVAAVLMPFVAHRVFGWTPAVIDDTWGLTSISNGHAYSLCNSTECNRAAASSSWTSGSRTRRWPPLRGYRGEEYVRLREEYEPGYRDRNERLAAGVGYLDEVEGFLSSPAPVHDHPRLGRRHGKEHPVPRPVAEAARPRHQRGAVGGGGRACQQGACTAAAI